MTDAPAIAPSADIKLDPSWKAALASEFTKPYMQKLKAFLQERRSQGAHIFPKGSEYFHALDGGYGGLWRRNGRPPQMLCGVGFSAQGLFEGSFYRRMPDAANPRADTEGARLPRAA